MVLKPSELTPLTALAMAELGERAGIPLGVLNVVVGDAKSIGDELIKSDEVRKIAFTGSTRVGKILMAGAASTVKKVSMELGGNAPYIVFPDAGGLGWRRGGEGDSTVMPFTRAWSQVLQGLSFTSTQTSRRRPPRRRRLPTATPGRRASAPTGSSSTCVAIDWEGCC